MGLTTDQQLKKKSVNLEDITTETIQTKADREKKKVWKKMNRTSVTHAPVLTGLIYV